ncbi:ScbA/BarX family gamma-butyrolactone biosynthesis protein [Kitasatospora sp. NBC_01539]|uniref:ScbA/BarX family gamma-butyrolactone biosynthesis protein n=1 Tax=Kitasatospora sp. NBC_01539 TaxID=2903577 RepID=UPI0038602354
MNTLAPAHRIAAADAVPAPRAAAQLDFHRTVSRKLVHKSAVSEVFLTDSERAAGDRFLLAAQWPRDHAVFQPGPGGLTDSMVVVETARQASIFVFHRYYGVPLDVPFLVRSMDFAITDLDALAGSAGPQEVTLDLTVELPAGRSASRMPVLTRAVVRTADGRPCAEVSMAGDILDRRIYQRIRSRRAVPSADRATARPDGPCTVEVPPAAVGRRRPGDVVLVPAGDDRWRLRVDQHHPTFFDHSSDHVQAVLLLEALRQYGMLTAEVRSTRPSDVLCGLSVQFRGYAELDSDILLDPGPAAIAERSTEERVVRVRATQDGAVILSARLAFRSAWQHVSEEI